MSPETVSDKKRAFDALRGITYPRVGQRGRWTGTRYLPWGGMKPATAVVEVVRISATGKTLWTRFVSQKSTQRYGAGPHRWERWPGETNYWCGGNGTRRGPGGGAEIYGEVEFTEVARK